MKRRWNSNTWVLVILGGVLLLTGFDVGRRYLLNPKSDIEVSNPADPKFKVGDIAPDFKLPDKGGVKHTLASMVKKDTVLCFLCGCNSCRQMQTYLGTLIKKLGPDAPEVISVTTQVPEFEERYKEITHLPQTLLYEKHGGDVMQEYRGNPCPRIYKLDSQRRVAWIGPSNMMLPRSSEMSRPLATALGFRNVGDPTSAKPLAPPLIDTTPIEPKVNPNQPPGTVMGPNGPMPAHVPVAPGQSNPPGVGGAPMTPAAVPAASGAHEGHGPHDGHGH